MNPVLCDVCQLRPATGGNIREIDGADHRTFYCDTCKPFVPIGHTVLMTSGPVEREQLDIPMWRIARALAVQFLKSRAGIALMLIVVALIGWCVTR